MKGPDSSAGGFIGFLLTTAIIVILCEIARALRTKEFNLFVWSLLLFWSICTMHKTSKPHYLEHQQICGLLAWMDSTFSPCLIQSPQVPQSVCTRHGLFLGAAGSPIIRLAMLLFYPITKPQPGGVGADGHGDEAHCLGVRSFPVRLDSSPKSKLAMNP